MFKEKGLRRLASAMIKTRPVTHVAPDTCRSGKLHLKSTITKLRMAYFFDMTMMAVSRLCLDLTCSPASWLRKEKCDITDEFVNRS